MTTHDDAPAAGSRRALVQDREDAVVARLHSLGTALDGEPSAEFRAATRSRLVAMAAVRSPAPAPRSALRRLTAPAAGPAPRWRSRLTAGLAAAALTVTAVATLVAVSANARPGDVLYGLKRGTEQTQLALAGDSRGQTLLDLATTRLAELDGLVDHGSSTNQALVLSTLRTMDTETTQGASWLAARAVATRSAAPAQQVSTWSAGQSAGLAALVPEMPAGARSSAQQSLDLLQRIDVRSTALTTALACPGGAATQGSDALGPVPAACPSTGTGTTGGSGTGGTLPSTGSQQGTGATPTLPATGGGAANGGAQNGSTPTGQNGGLPGTNGATPSGGAGALVPGAPTVPTRVPSLPTLPTTQPKISVPVPLPLPVPGSSKQSSPSTTATSPIAPIAPITLPLCVPVLDPAC